MKENDIVYTIATGEIIRFRWNTHKALLNQRKHHVSFEQAISVWSDRLAVEFNDLSMVDEPRYIRRGFDLDRNLLIVVFAEWIAEDLIRIISARRATLRERKQHEERV